MIRFVGSDAADAARFIRGPGDVWIDTSTTPPTYRICIEKTAAGEVRFEHRVRPTITRPTLPGSLTISRGLPTAPDTQDLMPSYVNSFLLPQLETALIAITSFVNSEAATISAIVQAAKESGLVE